MNFTLQILGAASAMPNSDMNPSAQALTVQGRLFLIDCGEGTQQQMRRMHLSFLKVEAIFLSHIHGDHLFGIFGLLSTMAMYNRTETLHIFGPANFASVLKFHLAWFGEGMNYHIEFHPLEGDEPQEIWTSHSVRVTAFPLRHKIECYGYRFDEIQTERQAALKAPKSYAYCSDTMAFPELAGYVKGVHVIYHEATYPREFGDKARARFHSTTDDAARVALEAGAQKLLVGHYTSRVRDLSIFENECRETFSNTTAVKDGDIFEIV